MVLASPTVAQLGVIQTLASIIGYDDILAGLKLSVQETHMLTHWHLPSPVLVQAEILNPLAVADYHAMGVRHIMETEEAIAAMGHLADDSVLLQLEQGVELGQEDFVDPTLMFGDEGEGGGGWLWGWLNPACLSGCM